MAGTSPAPARAGTSATTRPKLQAVRFNTVTQGISNAYHAEIIQRGQDRLGIIRSHSNDDLIEKGIVIGGNADTVCRQVERWAKVGLDQMLLMMQVGYTTHDQIMRALELFGEKVIPQFAEKSDPTPLPRPRQRERCRAAPAIRARPSGIFPNRPVCRGPAGGSSGLPARLRATDRRPGCPGLGSALLLRVRGHLRAGCRCWHSCSACC